LLAAKTTNYVTWTAKDRCHRSNCYSGQIRGKYAPVNYTDALKRQQIREYGYANTRISDYEEDHLISLELGGHPNDPVWSKKSYLAKSAKPHREVLMSALG
jgi:hypothetical protein